MNWFNNLNVGTKLISGFLIVAAIAALVGIQGITTMRKLDAASNKMYEKVTIPLGDIGFISTSFQRVRINLRDVIASKDEKEKKVYLETLAKLSLGISER